MKKITFILIVILAFTACKKDKSTTPNNGGGNMNSQSFIKFKADGVQYQFDIGTTFLDNDVEQLGFGYNNGNASDFKSISMIFDDNKPLGVNTYTFVKNSMNSIIFNKSNTDKNNNEYFLYPAGGSSGNASVTVTKMKLDPGASGQLVYYINGTFSAKLYNKNGGSVNITEGEFFEKGTN